MTKRMLKVMSLVAGATMLASTLAFTGGSVAFAAGSPGSPGASVVQQENVGDEKGVLIVSVERGGPAAKAGLKRGDIVLKVNDQEVNTAQELRDALAKLKSGEEAQLSVSRGDNEITLKVTLGDRDGTAYLGVTPFADLPQVLPAPQAPSQAPSQTPKEQPKQDESKQLEGQLRTLLQTRVTDVVKDSPADKAGLKKDDIIVAVNDTKLDAQNDLAKVIGGYKSGDKVTLSIERNGQKKDIDVELGAKTDDKNKPFLGISYAPTFVLMTQDGQMLPLPFELPRDFRRFIPMPGQGQGQGQPQQTPRALPAQPAQALVVIREVTKDSPADKAGLKQGDVIVEVNGQMASDPQAVVDLVGKSKVGDTVKLTVQREGENKPVEIEVKLGENPNSKGKAFMGVALGAIFNMQMEGNEGADGTQGFEIMPGFRFPFNFDFGNMTPAMPEQDDSQGSTL